MFVVIASSCAREYQQVCVCAGPWFAWFLIPCQSVCVCVCVCVCVHACVCVYACEWVHPPAFVFICLLACSYVHCTCLADVPARLCACICACLPLAVCACVCVCARVFPWAFRVSLRGLVLLIRLCVWGHGCRVGLHRGDPGTDGGQSLLPHSCEEGDRQSSMDKKTCGKKRRAWILFSLPFLSFFNSSPSFFLPLIPPFLPVRICKEFHKISPFTRLCCVCVCVSYYMCILRESSVNTSSSACSHDLGLSHSGASLFFFFFFFFPVKELRKDKPYLPKMHLHSSLTYWQGRGGQFDTFWKEHDVKLTRKFIERDTNHFKSDYTVDAVALVHSECLHFHFYPLLFWKINEVVAINHTVSILLHSYKIKGIYGCSWCNVLHLNTVYWSRPKFLQTGATFCVSETKQSSSAFHKLS